MNLNKNFIEVYDVLTNDYKIVERKSDDVKKQKKGFFFGNMFKKDRASQEHNDIYLESETDLIDQMPKPMPETETDLTDQMPKQMPKAKPMPETKMPEQKKEMPDMKEPETKKEVPKKIFEPEFKEYDDYDLHNKKSDDTIKRTDRPSVKAERDEAFPTNQPTAPIQQPFAPEQQPFMPSPTASQPPFMPSQPFQPFQPEQPAFPGPFQPLPPQPRPPFPPSPRPPVPPRPRPPAPRPPFVPTPPVFPPFPPASNRAILLFTQLYYELGNLQILYLQLAGYAPDVNSASQLNGYANEVLILRQSVLQIYRTLTGRTLPATSSRFLPPVLTGDYCTDLGIVYSYANSISSNLLQLIRIVDINNINRQLSIILATMNNQIIGLNNLLTFCG